MGLITGGLSMLMGIGDSITSSIQAVNARKEQSKKGAVIEQNNRDNNNLLDKQYYQRITDRADIQDIMRRNAEDTQAMQDKTDAMNEVAGATTAQQNVQNDAIRKSNADRLAQITSNAMQLKDGIFGQKLQQNNIYAQNKMNIIDQLTNSWNQASANSAQASANALSAGANMIGDAVGSNSALSSALDPVREKMANKIGGAVNKMFHINQ